MKKLSKKKVKERRKVGIAKAYLSRAAAIRKLQVSLVDFRRLCILKGVYPVEPKNKSKLGGSNVRRKTYFFARDIQMLMNEPLLAKFCDFKVFMKRLQKSQGRHDVKKFQRTLDNKPFYKLDALVKERYPRFVDALRDMDDTLSMCFLFSMFPKNRSRPDDLVDLSRKLTIEFMHYIIHTKSLRKVFISIKGYYYQAEIMGQTVTWIVPHQFVIDRTSDVDMNVMKTFTEFYITFLGFINYRLYTSINAIYPPKLISDHLDAKQQNQELNDSNEQKLSSKRKRDDEQDQKEFDEDNKDLLIAALNKKLRVSESKTVSEIESVEQQPDKFDEPEEEESSKREPAEKLDPQQVLALEQLFNGLKFFLNREVPRESLTFIIRSFGGVVSWDKNLFPGATFDENDEEITHHIMDRPRIENQYLNRSYVQPQWVFDCINMRMLLPVKDYLIGATLPPHLSPFVNEKKGDYVPPDKIKLLNLRKQFEAENATAQGGESELEGDTDLEAAEQSEAESEVEVRPVKKRPSAIVDSEFDSVDLFGDKKENAEAESKSKNHEKNKKRRERDSNKSTSRSKMLVKTGKVSIEDREKLKRQDDAEHRKMGIMMIPKKRKRLFEKITRTQREKNQKVENLRSKRRIVDAVKSRSRRSNRN